MKFFKQLVLVSAVAAASTGAFALEAMDDAALATKTGQDGLTITINPANGITMGRVLVHDNDGLDSNKTYSYGDTVNDNGTPGDTTDDTVTPTQVNLGGTDKAGAIVVENLRIQGNEIIAKVDTDGGSDTDNNKAFLNVGVELSGTHTVSLDGVYIGKSNGDNGTNATVTDGNFTGQYQRGTAGTDADLNKILGGLSISLTDAAMNVQLGNEKQGALLMMDTTLTGGLTIDDLEVVDSTGHNGGTGNQGALYVGKATITNNDSTGNLRILQKIDIDGTDGLVITMDDAGGHYVYLSDVGFTDGETDLGATPPVGPNWAGGGAIGDVEIAGLKMGSSTISVTGH